MTICKTLSLALIALSFGACAGANATHSTATATDAAHSATMDMDIARSDLDVSDAPGRIFTAVIRGEDRKKFGTPEISLKEKRICVSGLIEEYRGAPRIILRKASQLVEEQD